MKAIRVSEFGPPEVLHLGDVPDPKPGPGEVVVRVRAIGVNPVDTYIRSGTYHIRPELPYTPGMDAAGVIESIGEGIGRVGVGDRVYTSGTISGAYAEQALCNEAQVHKLPENVSFAQGAGINIPYSAAYHALFHRAKAVPDDVLLVHGAEGGVGVAAVQFALAAGLTIIGTGGSERGLKLVADQGAHHVLNHNDPHHWEEVLAVTEGRGVDVILEMLANVNLGKDLGLLVRFGRVVIIGSRGTVEINPRDAMIRDATILGMLLMNATEVEIRGIHKALFAGLRNGALCPVVGRELPMAEAQSAHRSIIESSAYGKTVLIP